MPTITTAYKGDMAFGTVLGRHRLLIDVPAAMGGKDRGPTPPELFVASLGSCGRRCGQLLPAGRAGQPSSTEAR